MDTSRAHAVPSDAGLNRGPEGQMLKSAHQAIRSIRRWHRRSSYTISSWIGRLLVVGSIAYMTWSIGVRTEGSVASQHEAIGELIALLGGIAGSFMASRSAFRSHARSAFRRLLSMYEGLGEIARTTEVEFPDEHESALQRIGAIASVHYGTARDALEDWSDLAPHEVAELKDGLTRPRETSDQWDVDAPPPTLGRGAVSTNGGSEHG